jgi:hypothetical protein
MLWNIISLYGHRIKGFLEASIDTGHAESRSDGTYIHYCGRLKFCAGSPERIIRATLSLVNESMDLERKVRFFQYCACSQLRLLNSDAIEVVLFH